MRKTQKHKLDELRIMLGIEGCDMEALLKAKPNSKEMQILKFYKEATERAETLGRINRDLEKEMKSLTDDVDEIRKEKTDLERKYHDSFINMEHKIEKFTNIVRENEKKYVTQI